MGLVAMDIQDANGNFRTVMVDDVAGNYYPVHKLGYGLLGDAPTIVSDDNPLPVSDIEIDVSKGLVTGHKILNIPGFHKASVETGSLGDLSLVPGVVVLPVPGGIQMELVSSSGDDDATGTGIRTVSIVYLDANYDEQTETVTLDGTSPVNTVATNIQEVQWMAAATVGSGGVAAGNISLRNTAGDTTYEYIGAGGNQSLTSRYTVPNGKTGHLLAWHVSGLKKRIDFFLRAECFRDTRALNKGVFHFQDFEVCEASNSSEISVKGLSIPAKATVKISAQADGATGEAGGGFHILVVDD